MKRRILIIVFFTLITSIFVINQYFKIEYGIGLNQYLNDDQELTEEEIQWLDEHGPLIYAADQNAPPLRYKSNQNDQFQGMVVDYIRALSFELESQIIMKPLVWEEALKSLEAGQSDICDMFPSEERSEKYLFTNPIYRLRGIVAIKEQSKLNKFEDLNQLVIGTPSGDYAIEFLNKNYPNTKIVKTSDIEEAIKMLESNELDAVVGDEPVISYFVNQLELNDTIESFDEPLYQMDTVLAVPKDQSVLVDILNKGIYNLNRRNYTEKIQQKWFGISLPVVDSNEKEKINLIIMSSFLYITILLYGGISWNKKLQSEVDKRTKELKIKTNELEATFDSIDSIIAILDSNREIIQLNKNAIKKFDLEEDDYQYSFKAIDFLKHFNQEVEFDSKKTTNGGKITGEWVYNNRNYNYSVIYIDSLIEKNIILLIFNDITLKKINERKLIYNDKMRTTGQLAAGIAHELRNPLGIIKNFSYILKNEIPKNDVTELSIEKIDKAIDRSDKIINNLLDFSKPSNNNLVNTDIHQLINEILDYQSRLINKNNIKITIEDNIQFEKVLIYKEAIHLVLLNVIKNGLEALDKNGSLVIKLNLKEDSIRIDCIDNGQGIQQEYLDHIFEPFFTKKDRNGGIGLGLYVTYTQLQKIGGDIVVESSYNQGTHFKIVFPIGGSNND